jgi:integrase
MDRLQANHIIELFKQLAEPGQNKRTGGCLSPKTQQNYHRILSSILTTAVHWGVIKDNPAKRTKAPKVPRREAKCLDDEQTVRLLTALENEPLKYKVAVELLIFTGARRGEVMGLLWSDIDFKNHTISINKASLYLAEHGVYVDTPKNESSQRVVKLTSTVIESMKKLRTKQYEDQLIAGDQWHGTDYVFIQWNGLPMHPETVSGWFSRFIKRYNNSIDTNEDYQYYTNEQKDALRLPVISPHKLRHTNATLMIAGGMDIRTVANRLGHAQTSTTTNIYSHAIKSADARASEILEDALLLGKRR